MKENGHLHSDSRRKAKILNNQFCSVSTSEDTTNIPKLPGLPNTEMSKFEITVQGVTKLLKGLNGRKASVPDELPNLILNKADDWVEANVAQVFKKKVIRTLWQTTGRCPSHVFVPNYLNTSIVNKLCTIFRKTKF